MMISARNAMLKLLLGGSALAFASVASAGNTPPDLLDNFVWPPKDASSVDELYALYAGNCGRMQPDEDRTHEIRRTAAGIEIDIYVVPGSPFCPAVVLPDTLFSYPLGRLPPGVYTMTRRILQLSGSGSPRVLREHSIPYAVGDVPHPAASGSWYDPAKSGSGVFLNLLSDGDGNPSAQGFIYLLTRTGSGEAAWLGGIGQFSDNRMEVAMQPPGGANDPDAAVDAVFTYTGCGTARFAVEDDADLEFPNAEAELVQLTRTGGVAPCEPPQRRPDYLD